MTRYIGVLAIIAVPDDTDTDELHGRVGRDGLGEHVQYLQLAPFTGSTDQLLADLAQGASLDPTSWEDPWSALKQPDQAHENPHTYVLKYISGVSGAHVYEEIQGNSPADAVSRSRSRRTGPFQDGLLGLFERIELPPGVDGPRYGTASGGVDLDRD